MHRRILAALAALVFAAIGAAPVSAAGPCAGADPNATNQMYVDRTAATWGAQYLDVVEGTATAQVLEVCIGGSLGPPETCNGRTDVLLANVQADSGAIHQIGYGRCSGEGVSKWTYVLSDGVPHHVPNGTNGNGIAVIEGHVYRGVIYRRSTGYVSFNLWDLTVGDLIWTYYPTTVWTTNTDHAWWGYETLDDASDHGHSHGDGDYINLRSMRYSTNASTNLYTVQIASGQVKCGGTGCASNHHAHVGTTAYNNDTLDADTGP